MQFWLGSTDIFLCELKFPTVVLLHEDQNQPWSPVDEPAQHQQHQPSAAAALEIRALQRGEPVAASSLSAAKVHSIHQQLAGNAARDNKKTRIIPRHIQLAYPASNTRLLQQRYVLFSVVSHHQGHGKLRFIASINSISLVLPPTTRRRKLLTFCFWFIWILYA